MTKTKSEIIDYINQYIVSNVDRRVTPEDIRTALLDIINSIHILTDGENILAGNLGSPPNKNTRVGEEASPNIIGDENTSVGYSSSYCNLNGDGNVSLGAYSLQNNTSGNLNVAIGIDSLSQLKDGNNNIAIGAYAGYYIGSGDSNQLFIGSHPINSDFVNNNPSGDPSIVPLLRGDLQNLILGIGTDNLNDGGTLQVNGDVTPSITDQFSLGSDDYTWNKIHIKDIDSNSNIKISKSIEPNGPNISIGTQDLKFKNLHVENIFVSENAEINNTTNTTSINSYNKKIHLSTSGVNPLTYEPKAILTDEGLENAGLYLWSVGTGQDRSYSISFLPTNFNLNYLVEDNVKSKLHWNSNISFSTSEGRHILTDMVRGRQNLSLLNQDGNTIFLADNIAVGQNDVINEFKNWDHSNNFNFISSDDYVAGLFSTQSGVVLGLDMFSRYEGNQDELYGFAARYYDEENPLFLINSLNGDSSPRSSFVIMRDEPKAGFSYVPFFKPETTFNVYGSGDSVVRFSGNTSSIQLSTTNNSFNKGFEIKAEDYRVDFNFNSLNVISIDSGNIFFDSPLKIKSLSGDLSSVSQVENYGSLTVKDDILYFINSDGNSIDLLSNSTSNLINNFALVYHDLEKNTIAGRTIRTSFSGTDSVILGSDNISTPDIWGDKNILIGTNLSIFEQSNINSQNSDGNILIGFNDDLFIEGKMPTDFSRGYFIINDSLQINGSQEDSYTKMHQDGNSFFVTLYKQDFQDNTLLELKNVDFFTNPSNFSHVFSNNIPSLSVKGDLNLYGSLKFTDGTLLSTMSGVPTVAGNGVSIDYDNNTKLTSISFNLNNIEINNENNIFGNNSNVIIETDGEILRSPISQLSQFVNHTNPQFLFQCSFGYNLVFSNNTSIDHSKNCNNIFMGNQAGNQAIWLTNSVIIGANAGSHAYISNIGLDGDVSLVAIGHNAGKKSKGSDNSVFIGPSAGQDTDCSDNSIFIGNSAGQSSHSKKSIGIGDNALESVKGRNNLEIIPNKDFNKLINGSVSNKFNIAGSLMGDMCVGRVSVGGSARIFPSAALEVSAKHDDKDVSLQNWYNSNGDLVAFLDQQGNLRIKGSVLSGRNMLDNNRIPSILPNNLSCGNENYTGNTSPINITNSSGNSYSEDFIDYSPKGFMLNYTMLFQEE
jgi:hypothetical protein